MNDTPREVDADFTERFRSRSGSERLRMMSEMFDAAKSLMAANIRCEHPDLPPSELRVRMFERLYFGEISDDVRARVIAELRRA